MHIGDAIHYIRSPRSAHLSYNYRHVLHDVYMYVYMRVVLKDLVSSLVFCDHRCCMRYLGERFAMESRK